MKSSFNDYEAFLRNVSNYSAEGAIPRELEEMIEHTTKEEIEAELRRLHALRLLHETGGINMGEETQTGGSRARLLEERDIPEVLEVLFTEEFYRKYPERMKNHLTRLAKRGLDKYENNLVAERDGKAVGRAVIDTPYPPYAELAGLLVHPKHRGQGVGTELVEGCICLARLHNCSVMYVMTAKKDQAVHRFYKKFGFQPSMLQGFEDEEKEICLFRFSDTPCYNEFLRHHPLSVLSVSGGKIDFHGNQVYAMKWSDPQTDDFLAFYLKGKRHESMPRITGIATKENTKAFEAWTNEITTEVTPEKDGKLKICLKNTGEGKLRLLIDFLLPEGTTVDDQPLKNISEELDEEASWELKFDIKPDSDVPPLSFWTILVTCQLQINGFSSAFPISAGFEMDRPQMKRKK